MVLCLSHATETNILDSFADVTSGLTLISRVLGKADCFYLPRGIRTWNSMSREAHSTRGQLGQTVWMHGTALETWKGGTIDTQHFTCLNSSRRKNSKQNIVCPLCLQKPSLIGPAIQPL